MAELIMNTKDYPGANGRVPQKDEYAWEVWFELETGDKLTIRMGKAGWDAFTKLVRECNLEDQVNQVFGEESPQDAGTSDTIC